MRCRGGRECRQPRRGGWGLPRPRGEEARDLDGADGFALAGDALRVAGLALGFARPRAGVAAPRFAAAGFAFGCRERLDFGKTERRGSEPGPTARSARVSSCAPPLVAPPASAPKWLVARSDASLPAWE